MLTSNQVLGNLLALAAVCPFVGSLSDLMGRRYVALTGASFIVIGMIVCSTAHTMNVFIGKSSEIALQLFYSCQSRRNGSSGCWSRDQRAHSSSSHIGACSYSETWQICSGLDLHHCPVLSIRAVGTAYRLPCRLEILRSTLRCLGRSWSFHDPLLLFPTSQSKFARIDQERNHWPN